MCEAIYFAVNSHMYNLMRIFSHFHSSLYKGSHPETWYQCRSVEKIKHRKRTINTGCGILGHILILYIKGLLHFILLHQ